MITWNFSFAALSSCMCVRVIGFDFNFPFGLSSPDYMTLLTGLFFIHNEKENPATANRLIYGRPAVRLMR